MDSQIDLEAIWICQKIKPIAIQAVYENIAKLNRINKIRLILMNSLLLLTGVVISIVVYWFQPILMTTKIGVGLIVFAIGGYLSVYNYILGGLMVKKIGLDANAHLNYLIELKQKQLWLQAVLLKSYFILLFVGLTLYSMEYLSRMNFWIGVIMYTAFIIWIIFNWIYLRPKIMTKQQLELNLLIVDLQRMKEQLRED